MSRVHVASGQLYHSFYLQFQLGTYTHTHVEAHARAAHSCRRAQECVSSSVRAWSGGTGVVDIKMSWLAKWSKVVRRVIKVLLPLSLPTQKNEDKTKKAT